MAKLEKVVVRNFRNVDQKELALDASEPSNIISGPNMTGKTNTLNAIHWAFTGTTIDGSADNRANFPLSGETKTSVLLDFGTFTFERVCEMVDDTPSVSIYVNGDKAKTVKNGEAILYAKLGLSDIVLTQPKDFNIVKFLINPLYFETVKPMALRKFFYSLADINFNRVVDDQIKAVQRLLEEREQYDPYKLCEAINKDEKAQKKIVDGCKVARDLFPSITEEANKKEKEALKVMNSLETDEALAEKYALNVSKRVNKYYENAMGIQVCLLEKGVGEDVYKDVCYPILPKSKLPFAVGSYAERSYIGTKFIQEFCLKFNVKPLPILLDNMESLDEYTRHFVDGLGVQYIGALVD